MYKAIFLLLFILIIFSESHSVVCNHTFILNINTAILFNSDSLDKHTVLSEKSDNSEKLNDSLTNRISQDDFTYADNLRYTINGKLPLVETDINYYKFGLLSGIVSGFMISQHIYQSNTIWADKAKFRIIEDGKYALYSDKIGHFYGAYFSGYVYSELLIWSGFSNESAAIAGGLMGLAYQTYIEVMDGYAENWGFSPTDFYADLAGSGFFILQHYVPWFQNITPKFQYFPATWHGEKKRDPSEFFIDDYSSQSLYFSFNVYNMLPDNLKKYWLPWLQLSVGYAARNLCDPIAPNSSCDPRYSTIYGDAVAGSPRLIIALDYDFGKILPDGIPIWNWFRQTLNYFKFPAPAIEISERGTRFLLMYPFFPL